jgi:hypothetical protein
MSAALELRHHFVRSGTVPGMELAGMNTIESMVNLSLCLTTPLSSIGEWMYSWRWVVRFTPRPIYPQGKSPGIHWIGGWVGPVTGLDDVEKRKFLILPGLQLRPLCHPARAASRYTDWAIPVPFIGEHVNIFSCIWSCNLMWEEQLMFSNVHYSSGLKELENSFSKLIMVLLL